MLAPHARQLIAIVLRTGPQFNWAVPMIALTCWCLADAGANARLAFPFMPGGITKMCMTHVTSMWFYDTFALPCSHLRASDGLCLHRKHHSGDGNNLLLLMPTHIFRRVGPQVMW
jgi:hypothetical protein